MCREPWLRAQEGRSVGRFSANLLLNVYKTRYLFKRESNFFSVDKGEGSLEDRFAGST